MAIGELPPRFYFFQLLSRILLNNGESYSAFVFGESLESFVLKQISVQSQY